MGIFKKIKKEVFWVFAIVLLIIPVYSRLLRPGFFPMHDDLQAFRVYEMDRCFDDWQIPCRWVPDAGYQYGYPQFNYYPPSVYYVGAVLHRLGIQYIDTVKLLFVAGYIVAAITMFMLVRSIFGDWPGFIAAIGYTYIPYKAVEVYVRGAMSEFWSMAIFPLIFWAIYLFIKTEKKKYFIWLAVSIGLLMTTHNLMTLIFAPFAVIWALFWLFITKKWHMCLKTVLSGLLGLGLAAFFFLPVLFERQFVHVESMLSGYFDYRQHFVSLYKLFLSREWGYGSSGFPNELLNLSAGLVQWVTAFVAVGLGIFNYKKERTFSILAIVLGAMALFALFMIHMKSSFIWARLPVLWWMQFPWRFLSVVIFLLSVLAGLAIKLSGKAKYFLGTAVALAAVLLNIGYFIPKDWISITDKEKFSGTSWQKQLTISIFDYLPIYATLPPVSPAPAEPEVLKGKVEFNSYIKGSNWQTGLVEATEDSVVRAPIFDFPGMVVTIDGAAVSHINDNCERETFCLGLVTFNLPKGSHEINIRLGNTPVRTIGNVLTIISFVAIIFIAVVPNKLKLKDGKK
jgi:hypothetical protein